MFVYSAKCKRPNICFSGKGYCCNSCKLGKTCESQGGDITSSLFPKYHMNYTYVIQVLKNIAIVDQILI